jgi:hypothetical protein
VQTVKEKVDLLVLRLSTTPEDNFVYGVLDRSLLNALWEGVPLEVLEKHFTLEQLNALADALGSIRGSSIITEELNLYEFIGSIILDIPSIETADMTLV